MIIIKQQDCPVITRSSCQTWFNFRMVVEGTVSYFKLIRLIKFTLPHLPMPVEQNREVHIITYYKKVNMEIKVHEHNSNHP